MDPLSRERTCDRPKLISRPTPSCSANGTCGRKALLVDDNLDLLVVMEQVFEGLGYTVTTANNGAEAVEALKKDPDISLLFSDVVMPGMSGIELAHLAQSLLPAIKIVLTSGFLPGLQIPASWAFIPKPFWIGELEAVLSE